MLLKSGIDHLDKVDNQSPEGIRVVAGILRLRTVKIFPQCGEVLDMLQTATTAADTFTVEAKKGRLALFYTRGEHGQIDPLSWHGGAAVIRG